MHQHRHQAFSYQRDGLKIMCVCSSQVCGEAVLKTLELMSKLRQKDQRMVTPLSLALTSNHKEHVQTGLRLLFEATPRLSFTSVSD
uniref:CIP2A N-terminal domain-containing protein n=1 Tax=Hucho hucho TaxID=62062 RepID=A0A4W5JIN0_9TELE